MLIFYLFFSLLLFLLLNGSVIILQRSDGTAPALLLNADSGRGRYGRRHRRDVRNPVLDRVFTDIAVVNRAFLADRRIHDQVDLAVGDRVKDIRPSFIDLLDLLCRNPCFQNLIAGALRRHDTESVLMEASGHFHQIRFVGVIDADQNRTGQGKLRTGSLLRFKESSSPVLKACENFSSNVPLLILSTI